MSDKALILNQDGKAMTAAPQVYASEADALVAVIARAASDPTVDVNKLEKLLDMRERIKAGQAEMEFNRAMAAMAPELPRVKKNGKVEYAVDKNNKAAGKEEAFRFATYEDIDKAIRPILSRHGFSVSFDTKPRSSDGGGCTVTGTLSHSAGHKKTASIDLALDSSGGKNNLQAMASTTSYGQRYTLKMLINLVFEGEDNDGNVLDPIDIEQAAEIDNRIRAMGEDYVKRFLKWAKVQQVTDIPKKHLNAVLAAISEAEAKAKGGAK